MSQAPTRHLVDQSTWKRKTQYDFFRDFAEPFWGLTVDVDCTKAYRYSKAKGYFFYHYYLHCSTAAAILVENFRYRIDEGQVYLYDSIDLAATVARPDETSGFSFIPYDPDGNEVSKFFMDIDAYADGGMTFLNGFPRNI